MIIKLLRLFFNKLLKNDLKVRYNSRDESSTMFCIKISQNPWLIGFIIFCSPMRSDEWQLVCRGLSNQLQIFMLF